MSLPTTGDVKEIEQLFFEQMRRMSRPAQNPQLTMLLRSFDMQCSDRWMEA